MVTSSETKTQSMKFIRCYLHVVIHVIGPVCMHELRHYPPAFGDYIAALVKEMPLATGLILLPSGYFLGIYLGSKKYAV